MFKNKRFFIFFIFLVCIGFDQISKTWVQKYPRNVDVRSGVFYGRDLSQIDEASEAAYESHFSKIVAPKVERLKVKVPTKVQQVAKGADYCKSFGLDSDECILDAIKHGAPLNRKDPNTGETAAHFVVRGGNVELLKALIEKSRSLPAGKGVDINLPDQAGATPLMIAVQEDDSEMVQALLSSHEIMKSVNKKGPDGLTVLDLVAQSTGSDDDLIENPIGKILLQSGARRGITQPIAQVKPRASGIGSVAIIGAPATRSAVPKSVPLQQMSPEEHDEFLERNVPEGFKRL
jgi:hypothetical protein